MSEEFYIVAIAALLPVTASLLVTQVNPYHALVIRGILGAVAALVYALFGAADVALTEALVGTMLSITLYAVAVRSSMSMRIGVLEKKSDTTLETSEYLQPLKQLFAALRKILSKHHMRLELVAYSSKHALQTALINKEVHGICVASNVLLEPELAGDSDWEPDEKLHLQIRIRRLYNLLQGEISPTLACLTYAQVADVNKSDALQRGREAASIEVQL